MPQLAQCQTPKQSNVRCLNSVNKSGIIGVEFLLLPPLCYYRGSVQPYIRAVLGSLRSNAHVGFNRNSKFTPHTNWHHLGLTVSLGGVFVSIAVSSL